MNGTPYSFCVLGNSHDGLVPRSTILPFSTDGFKVAVHFPQCSVGCSWHLLQCCNHRLGVSTGPAEVHSVLRWNTKTVTGRFPKSPSSGSTTLQLPDIGSYKRRFLKGLQAGLCKRNGQWVGCQGGLYQCRRQQGHCQFNISDQLNGRFHFEADGTASKFAFGHPLFDRNLGHPVLGH